MQMYLKLRLVSKYYLVNCFFIFVCVHIVQFNILLSAVFFHGLMKAHCSKRAQSTILAEFSLKLI